MVKTGFESNSTSFKLRLQVRRSVKRIGSLSPNYDSELEKCHFKLNHLNTSDNPLAPIDLSGYNKSWDKFM